MECSAILDIYTTNEELIILKQGIVNFLNRSENEFEWTSGEDKNNVSHFLSMNFFKHNDRGYVGIEILADNKSDKPYNMRVNFSIITVISQLDDLIFKLDKLINEEIIEFESIIPSNEI